MYFTGFADEASKGIDGQIKATRELGWTNIESRNIDGKNIHDMADADFDVVCGKLKDAGVSVNCFGSAIANWGKKIEDPFDITLLEIKRTIPRMKKLGTKLIRIMSYAVIKDRGPEDQMKEERFKRLREICRLFKSEGLEPVHENCMNFGGMGWKYTLELVDNVPGLKLVYDTGNPVFTDDRCKATPYPKQSAWEFYAKVKKHVAYIHIKDGIWDTEKQNPKFTYPGEGHGDVKKIVADLLKSGYDGGISIEPHLAVVFHDESVKSEEDVKYRNYVEYGRRMMKMVDDIRAGR
jgi:sugar phosphate isomerase/epimerase